MSDETTTTDLAKFGFRERRMAADLLATSCDHGFPADFEDEGVTIMMTMHNGHVFLTNADFQTARMNGDKLESFYSCPECGHEGFADEMRHDGNAECTLYLEAFGVAKDADDATMEPQPC